MLSRPNRLESGRGSLAALGVAVMPFAAAPGIPLFEPSDRQKLENLEAGNFRQRVT